MSARVPNKFLGAVFVSALALVLCAPGTLSAQSTLLRDGIFGCNASQYSNIGTLTAIGGVYVPVNDAAVTLNTGYLVYKECVLDGVVAKIGEAARTELAGTILRQLTVARQGQALYVRQVIEESAVVDDRTTLTIADPENTSAICQAFRQSTVTTEVRRYLSTRSSPQGVYACSFPGDVDHEAAQKGKTAPEDVFKAIGALARPGNDPLSATLLFHDAADNARATARYAQEKQWDWGNGFYSVTNHTDNPFAEEILTPASLVAEGARQAGTSGFRCLEGADELSEVCAPMFAGITTQLVASAGGLTGLAQPGIGAGGGTGGGTPSYISQMISAAGAGVRQEAMNAALNILVTARQVEAAFLQAKQGIAAILTNSINRLKTAESACWGLIVDRVCSSPPNAQKRCSAVNGGTLQVATSTEFSQAVINAQIAPVATIAAEDLQKSSQALAQIDALIAQVTNTASTTAQQQALLQLDQMVANGILHTAAQAQAANKQLEDVTGSANALVEDTLRAWGDDLNPSVGWCNVNNQPVIDMWIARWKQ